jgi:hypothetical protein
VAQPGSGGSAASFCRAMVFCMASKNLPDYTPGPHFLSTEATAAASGYNSTFFKKRLDSGCPGILWSILAIACETLHHQPDMNKEEV